MEGKSEERRVKNSIDSFKKGCAVENSLRPLGYGLIFETFYLFTFYFFLFNPSNFYKLRYKVKRLKTGFLEVQKINPKEKLAVQNSEEAPRKSS